MLLYPAVPSDDQPAKLRHLRYPDRVLRGRRGDRAGWTNSPADLPAWITRVGHVRTQAGQRLRKAQHVSVNIEAYGGLFDHAARAEVSYARAHRTSSTDRSNRPATTSTSSPELICSHRTSVLTPPTAGRPNRISGVMRTGERSSACGRHPAAMSPSQVTRS